MRNPDAYLVLRLLFWLFTKVTITGKTDSQLDSFLVFIAVLHWVGLLQACSRASSLVPQVHSPHECFMEMGFSWWGKWHLLPGLMPEFKPEPMWWRKRTDFSRLPSDLYLYRGRCMSARVYIHTYLDTWEHLCTRDPVGVYSEDVPRSPLVMVKK